MPVAYDPSSLALIMALVANARPFPAPKPRLFVAAAEPPAAKRVGRPSSFARNDPDVTRMVNDRLAGGARP